MVIKVNETIPDVKVKVLGPSGPEDVSTHHFFKGKTSVLIGLPGAFTPVCTQQHIPGYKHLIEELKGKGVDQVACVAINDPFVMKVWADHMGVTSSIQMLADWQGQLTKALGLEIDLSAAGLGTRTARFAMIVKDGKVADLQIDNNPLDCKVTSASSILGRLGTLVS